MRILKVTHFKSNIALFVGLCFVLFSTNVFGQETVVDNKSKFTHITSTDGLMHNSMSLSFQDSRGYLWLGTRNGLYKYDGYTYKIYNNELGNQKSLIGNRVLSLAEDKNGILWIGTTKGLCYYDRNSDCFIRSFPSVESTTEMIFNNAVNSMFIDEQNALWIGTPVGLYHLTSTKEGYKTNVYRVNNDGKGLAASFVFALVPYKDNLLVATRKGINIIKYKNQEKVEFSTINEPNIEGVNIVKLVVDDQNTIWAGTLKGLHKIKEDSNHKFHVEPYYLKNLDKSLSGNQIRSLLVDRNSKLWIGTLNSGIIHLDTKNRTVENYQYDAKEPYSLRSNEVNNIFKDKFDVLWVCTSRGGVSKLDLHKKKIDHFKNNILDPKSLSGNMINSIYEDSKGNVWICTFGKGINVLTKNDSKNNFIKLGKTELGSDNFHSVCEDKFGNIWLGSFKRGLFRVRFENGKIVEKINFNKENTKGVLSMKKIVVLCKDSYGDIWFGGDLKGGLIRMRPSEKFHRIPELEKYKRINGNVNSLTSDAVYSIYEDSNGILWVGFNGQGLVKIIRDTNNNPIQYIRLRGKENNPLGLNNNVIFDVLEDSKHNIWISTFGGGLNKIPREELGKKNPKVLKYKLEQGLPSNEIYGVLEDADGALWISTNNGISKYDVEKNKFKNFGLKDGLQALNFRRGSYFKTREGMLYFGGINGVNRFNPTDFKINKIKPITELVGFKLFNKEVNVGEESFGKVILEKNISETHNMELENEHNSFSFEFSGLHFAAPKQNNYKYKLEGFDKRWISTTSDRRFAIYSNLNAGDYVFKVMSSNSDDIWSKNPRELKLKILPPLWKSWWAYLIYLLFAIFLMWLFRRFILISADYRNKIQIEKLEQNKIKEINKIKLEFFTNISHEFKTPLTLILGPLQNLINRENLDASMKEPLLIMDRNANHLFRLINQVMDFRKAETHQFRVEKTKGDLINFTQQVVASFDVLVKEKSLTLHFESDETEILCSFDWDKLEKILNNLISNSIKYTPERGSVFVYIGVKKGNLSEDNQTDSVVEIIVKDTGVGIPKNKISKIFNRFYQVQETNKSHLFGSGVGLALTKKLIGLLQGEIEVVSELNEGSKFLVSFPLMELIEPINENKEITLIDKPKNEIEKSSSKVLEKKASKEETDKLPLLLIVEDNLDMQKFLLSSMEKHYEIMQAYDGEQGLKLALEHVPNIIISDVMMDKMDGIEFCNEVKQNEITNHIPIILLTARGSVDHRIEGLEVGADAYIPKPFDMRILQVKTKKLLEERKFLSEKYGAKGLVLDSQKIGINQTEKSFLEKAEKVIEDNLMNSEFGVEDLGRELHFSRMQLYRKLKSIRGLSANEFIREYRIKKAALLLRETDMNVTEILYTIGFSNRSYFSKCFKQTFEMSPKEYAKKFNGKNNIQDN